METPAPGRTDRRTKVRIAALQIYRLLILVVIACLVRDHHVRLRISGDAPLRAEEVKSFLPAAFSLDPDQSERQGMFVLDAKGEKIGYVVRTLPTCNNITGYAGVTDTLIAFDPQWKVLGIKIRSSEDTRTHVEDIKTDRHFLKKWTGRTWNDVAALDLKKAGIEGVSGATMTSMAMAESITARLKATNEALAHRPSFRVKARDVGLLMVVAVALVMASTHLRGRKTWRRAFQILVIVYVGFLNGDLIAQSLLAGWVKSGVPWNIAPGLVLLVAAAFVVPWATKRPLYCLHICPHGASQEWLGRLGERMRWRIKLPTGLSDGLKWLPSLFVMFVLLVVMLVLPFDLAGLEPFDAYIIKSAGWATLTVAAVGLIASIFIPQAYCRYGCPTGALLEYVRSHGANDRFGRRDVVALLMVAVVAVIYWKFPVINAWLTVPA